MGSSDAEPVGSTVSEVSAQGILAWVLGTSSDAKKKYFGCSLRGDEPAVATLADLEYLTL
jgi:hypothetical protein